MAWLLLDRDVRYIPYDGLLVRRVQAPTNYISDVLVFGFISL